MAVRIRSFNKIRGDEPTIFIDPPRMAQNPMGIKSQLMGISVRTDIRLTTGRKSAAAPTFCMKDEMNLTVQDMIGMMRPSVEPPNFRMALSN